MTKQRERESFCILFACGPLKSEQSQLVRLLRKEVAWTGFGKVDSMITTHVAITYWREFGSV